ncbi:MAG TPA: VTT domain-containing protein, partial [Methylomirabilota bacterium]
MRPVLILALLVAGVVGARALGLGDLIRLENVARLKQWIEGFGALAPVVFIAGYVLAVVFFVPGLPITVLGGVAFGPVWGTLYVWIAATIGAALAFLVARYAVRSTVERWVRASPRLAHRHAHAARAALPVQPAELRLRTDPYRLLALRHHLVHLHAARHR